MIADRGSSRSCGPRRSRGACPSRRPIRHICSSNPCRRAAGDMNRDASAPNDHPVQGRGLAGSDHRDDLGGRPSHQGVSSRRALGGDPYPCSRWLNTALGVNRDKRDTGRPAPAMLSGEAETASYCKRIRSCAAISHILACRSAFAPGPPPVGLPFTSCRPQIRGPASRNSAEHGPTGHGPSETTRKSGGVLNRSRPT